VIEQLIASNKPIVGHNIFFDLLFVYNQFIDELPATLHEFSLQWEKRFPLTFDTKCMATSLAIFSKTDLKFLVYQFTHNKKYAGFLEFDYHEGFNKYAESGKLHEAAYDAYVTGVCFASMVKYLEVQCLIEFQKVNGQCAATSNSFERSELFVIGQRTGQHIKLPVPCVNSVLDLAQSEIRIPCAVE
jgi:DNA polymerase III epsilon subunit-like protein